MEDTILCDVETLTWAPLEPERHGDDLRLNLHTNWALVILRRPGGPTVVGFETLPALRAGELLGVKRFLTVEPGEEKGKR